jgi:hypothetical protein
MHEHPMGPFARSAARSAISFSDRVTPQVNPQDSPASGDSQPWLPSPDLVLRAALFAILGAMLASGIGWWFLGVDLLEFLDWLPSCAFRAWTGFPCPGCGMGHALIHLSRFELVAAVGANPAAPFIAAVMLVGALRRAPVVAVHGKRGFWAGACLALVLVGWLWRILPVESLASSGF